ncbi:MAG TPA: GGDEF domain-containing response regulator [Polyangia bacterium]|nr:GGDEF domain-containing response regulator [Polyangia bacterium]
MNKRAIILVDPCDTRETLAERLRMQGHQVTVTASPVAGAGLALADPPAAVIADLWMPGISGVQLCRLLRAEPATERVPVILRGPESDRQSRFWAERAGATAYVGQGRMGDLARALAAAIAAAPPGEDSFMQLCGEEEHDIRDRIAAHLDGALFESVLAAEVRALSVCGNFTRLFDLLSQFVSRVTSYRWLAVSTHRPARLGLHAHPLGRARAEEEARRALAESGEPLGEAVEMASVEDEDAYDDVSGAPPIVAPISLGREVLGTVALAPRAAPHPKDAELVAILARELAGPLRIVALMEESARLATTDALTGLMNRRAFTARLGDEIARSQRFGYPLSVLLLDVDHFKAINDRRGHPAGDAVLAAMGRLLGKSVRQIDATGRWGGEEFVVALTGTEEAGGLVAAERIRGAIAAMKVASPAGELLEVTASIGLATYQPGDQLDSLIDRADRAMYSAKTSGRNRVATAPLPPKPLPEMASGPARAVS